MIWRARPPALNAARRRFKRGVVRDGLSGRGSSLAEPSPEGGGDVSPKPVGVVHTSSIIRWYLTTVPRELLSAQPVIQAYRLRWLIELLFREIKQAADLGRSSTADRHALEALTYGAMLAHVLVRSLRIQAALANEIPLEQLRPLACLHVARAFARDIVDALASLSHEVWTSTTRTVTAALLALARELKPSRSRSRIASNSERPVLKRSGMLEILREQRSLSRSQCRERVGRGVFREEGRVTSAFWHQQRAKQLRTENSIRNWQTFKVVRCF
jgi:hypothetical protein